MKSLFLVALLLIAPTAAQAQSTSQALGVVVNIDVMPQFADSALPILRTYADSARHQPGALRFEVWRRVGGPNHFTLIEEWRDQAAFDAHVSSSAALKFRTQVQPFLGSPFDERLHNPLDP